MKTLRSPLEHQLEGRRAHRAAQRNDVIVQTPIEFETWGEGALVRPLSAAELASIMGFGDVVILHESPPCGGHSRPLGEDALQVEVIVTLSNPKDAG